MPGRPVLAALGASVVLVLGAVACGSSSAGPTGPSASPVPRIGGVAVAPTSGAIGTVFALTAKGLKQGEAVAFEITFPNSAKAYPGAALTVEADGTATTTYRSSTANEPGVYQVRLNGAPGTLAEGRFTVTDGPPITNGLPETTSSSVAGRASTTKGTGRTTTTVRGATTSTTLKGTTTTTRRVTTSSTPTTKAPLGNP